MPTPKIGECPAPLHQLSGAFVTIREENELRGCIGYIEGIKPLVEAVQEVAAKAAIDDPRFLPVSEEELGVIEIELSVISPLKHIKTVDEIEVGKHGLLIELRNYRGLLLPQVATEHKWDRETFLNQTARKAGLSSYAWKDPDVKISIFTAEIFGERPTTPAGR